MLLVVEDDLDIQDFLDDVLTDAGFEVVGAADGKQAIDELNTGARRFEAVITDIRLGNGPDGWEVGRHARELVPDMSVIYITGDSGHAWSSMGVPGSLLVCKPFAVGQIITAVSTLSTDANTRRAVSSGDR